MFNNNMTTIKGYPTTLRLFQIEDSPYWYARLYLNGKMHKRSSKTTEKREAIEFAKQFFMEMVRKQDGVKKGNQLTVVEVAEDVIRIDQSKVARGEKSSTLIRDQEHQLKKDVVPFFGNTTVKEVNYPLLLRYVERLTERNLASASIIKNLAFIKKIMKHAARIDAIQYVPEFPTVAHKDSPRGWLQLEEYKKLCRHAHQLAKKGVEIRGKPITKELNLLIRFMVNTFLRPSDVKLLKHKHVEVVIRDSKYLRITTDFSKTEKSPVISMASAIPVYEALQKYQKERGYGKTNDFIFLPQYQNRQFAIEIMGRMFDEALKAAHLKTSNAGVNRTLYSLRHTAIMFRLTMGDVDIITLAKNARTSIEMIERFYGNHLTAEMNVEKLQSMREKKLKFKNDETEINKPRQPS